MQAIVLVVLVVLVVAQVTLTLRVTRLRSRVGRFERDHGALSRTVATVQGWAEQQLRAVRGEFAVARVNDSADRVRELRAKKRPAAAAPPLSRPKKIPRIRATRSPRSEARFP